MRYEADAQEIVAGIAGQLVLKVCSAWSSLSMLATA